MLFYCYTTADSLTKLLQQCFLFFIVVVILGNSQVSVYRTICPTLVIIMLSDMIDTFSTVVMHETMP